MADFGADRRQFLIRAAEWSLALFAGTGGLVMLGSCQARQEAEEVAAQPHNAISAAQQAADPCNDTSGLSAGDLATRETFKYESRSSTPGRYCQTCQYWQPDRRGGPCGACTIVRGPIHPLGHCRSWAERTGA